MVAYTGMVELADTLDLGDVTSAKVFLLHSPQSFFGNGRLVLFS